MKKILFPFLVLFAITIFIGCENEKVDEVSNQSGPNDDIFAQNYFGNATAKNFVGQVVDEDNNAIQNAVVKIGSSTVQTDENGIFVINGAAANEEFAHITVKKSGYIDGSRSLIPTSGTNNVKIMMLSGEVLKHVASGVVSEVTLPNETKVIFDGNFKTATGSAYSGSVSVIMHHLDPSDDDLSVKMPGMLYAQTSNNQEVILETYGMINVELRGSGGEKLQIANPAQIEIPITASQLATAPSTIPLWHFDEAKGYWKEEGIATRVGNKYKGNVSHFSWWNIDAKFPTVKLCVILKDGNGNPISNVGVGLIRGTNTYPTMGITNNDGQVCGLIPANETLTMNIYDSCGGIIKTESIGPFSTDTGLPAIVIPNTLIQSTSVKGNLVKCNESNVTNGYVILHYKNQTLISTVTNGAFDFTTLVCNTSDVKFTLEGFDVDSLQETGEIEYMFTSPVTNIGNIQACTAVTEFISYQIDNGPVKYIIGNINANLYSEGTMYNGISIFTSTSPNTQQGVYINAQTNVEGIYTTGQFSINGVDIGSISSQTTNSISFNLNNVGAVGDYIDMTFNGGYTNSTGTHTINGVVHVIRDK